MDSESWYRDALAAKGTIEVLVCVVCFVTDECVCFVRQARWQSRDRDTTQRAASCS